MIITVKNNEDAADIVRGVESILFLLSLGYGAGIDKPTDNDIEAAAFTTLADMLDNVNVYLNNDEVKE